MRRKRWIQLILLTMAALMVASLGISAALQYGWARQSLVARLSESFGRPVEAGRFSFSLFVGPSLEVNSITVAEDPRFGQEYFLRAEQLSARLKWSALVRGRIEFGTLSLTRPSLNLVHASTGHWNVESWLPPVKEQAPGAAQGAVESRAAAVSGKQFGTGKQLRRIEIQAGRINFKRGQEKLLFALGDVTGHIDQDGAGRWSLDLQANPMRPSVALQDVGTLRLSGTVSGTSARLRPAALTLTWEDVSLADALRLASGKDYGVRGQLGAELSAKIEELAPSGDQESSVGDWTITGKMRLTGIHRWDLAARSGDPAVNVSATTSWRAGTSILAIENASIEAPQSQMLASGSVDWSHGLYPSVRVVSSSIAFADVLAWRRSFRPNLPDDLAIDGAADVQGALAGWPLRVEQASMSSGGAVIRVGTGTSLMSFRAGPISAALRGDSFALDPVSVSLPGVLAAGRRSRGSVAPSAGVPAGRLRVEGALAFRGNGLRNWPYRIAVAGQTTRAQDVMVAVSVFTRSAAADWKLEGPATLQLAWLGTLPGPASSPTGTIQLHGAQLSSAVLNQPVMLSSAMIELRSNGRRVKITDAQALGAHWSGMLQQQSPDKIWHVDLAADRLEAAELDRWLGPRAQPGFLQRMLPSAASSAARQSRNDAIEHLAVQGRLHVGELSIAPLHVEKVDAAVELTGRKLAVRNAQGQFFGGRVASSFEALLSADPTYTFRGKFDRVNLAALGAAAPSLDGHFAGLASGELSLGAHGIGMSRLMGSLAGQGDLQVRQPVLRGLDFSSVGPDAADPDIPTEGVFTTAIAGFRIAGGSIRIEQLSLMTRDQRFEIQGSVNQGQQLDLRAWSRTPGNATSDVGRQEWTIGGSVEAPLLTRQTPLARNRVATATAATGSVPARR